MQLNIFMRHLLLLVTLTNVVSGRRGKLINIFHNDANGDIVDFRTTGRRMYNALPRVRHDKWIKANGIVAIPYTFRDKSAYEIDELNAITEAMWRIQNNTCIRFKERENETDYFEIQNNYGFGCATTWGRIGGKEILHLEANDRDSCMEVGTVQHELMHIIGLLHEHMRHDRDEFITVHLENIVTDEHTQFERFPKQVAETYSVPYDYTSIMHYEKTAGSRNGRITLETHDPAYQDVIGKRHDASAADYKKICAIYECESCMDGNGKPIRIPGIVPDLETVTPEAECQDQPGCELIASGIRSYGCNLWLWKICCASCSTF